MTGDPILVHSFGTIDFVRKNNFRQIILRAKKQKMRVLLTKSFRKIPFFGYLEIFDLVAL